MRTVIREITIGRATTVGDLKALLDAASREIGVLDDSARFDVEAFSHGDEDFNFVVSNK